MITNIDATHKSTLAKNAQPHSLLAKWFLLEQATINSDLSSSAKSVLAALLFHHNTKTGRSFVGEDTIAAGLHLSTRQVQRCIRELQEKGWIIAERRFNKSSEYEFKWSRAVPVNKKRRSNDDMDVGIVHDAGVVQSRHGCHPITTPVSSNDDIDVVLTDIRTDIRTSIKNTHSETVSVSASPPSDERRFQMQNSNLTGKEVPHRESNASVKASPCPSPAARDASDSLDDERNKTLSLEDGNPFAHWDQENDFPSHQKNNIPSPSPSASTSTPVPAPAPVTVPGIAVPRGEMGWVTPENEAALKEWLISMGLSGNYANAMRLKTMAACFNDTSNATINTHKQSSGSAVPQQQTPISYSPPRPPKDEQMLERGDNRWRAMTNAIPALLSHAGSVPDGETYLAQARQLYDEMIVTAKASDDDIEHFCSLNLRDCNSRTISDLSALDATIAELEMSYCLLDFRRLWNLPKHMLRNVQEVQKKRCDLEKRIVAQTNIQGDAEGETITTTASGDAANNIIDLESTFIREVKAIGSRWPHELY
jgi:hypothetical protein